MALEQTLQLPFTMKAQKGLFQPPCWFCTFTSVMWLHMTWLCTYWAGWSNVATAVAGAGFTGSYIFSQTIFTMRSGVHSRINGFVIALLMLAIFVAPFSVIEFLPSYFFGSLMIWIGWEIARVSLPVPHHSTSPLAVRLRHDV